MTELLSRRLLRWALLLYPTPFRDEFADEMLSMFDECSAAQGYFRVLANVLLSAAKQQIHSFAAPAPKNSLLYSEIAWSPNLARTLAAAAFCVVLITSALAERGKPKPPQSWTRPCGWTGIAANQTIGQAFLFNEAGWIRDE